MKLQAGLYTIRAGANQEYNADQYASARERIESDIRVVGGRSSEWTQEVIFVYFCPFFCAIYTFFYSGRSHPSRDSMTNTL